MHALTAPAVRTTGTLCRNRFVHRAYGSPLTPPPTHPPMETCTTPQRTARAWSRRRSAWRATTSCTWATTSTPTRRWQRSTSGDARALHHAVPQPRRRIVRRGKRAPVCCTKPHSMSRLPYCWPHCRRACGRASRVASGSFPAIRCTLCLAPLPRPPPRTPPTRRRRAADTHLPPSRCQTVRTPGLHTHTHAGGARRW